MAELVRQGALTFGDGYRTKKSELGRPGIPILRVAEVHNGYIRPEFVDYVSADFRAAMGVKVSQPGDIVLTTKGTVGRVAVIPGDAPEFVYSPQVCFFRVTDGGPLVDRFLYYWFKSAEFWRQASSRKGQTDMADYLNLADIKELTLSLPLRTEQQSVVEVLGALDDKIELNFRIAAAYEQLLQLRFAELGLSDEPGSEEAIVITDLVEFNPKVAKPSVEEPVYVDMAALQTDRASIPSWARRPPKSGPRFMNGDTLLARITPCLENGKTGYVDFMEDSEVGLGSTEFIVVRSRPGVPAELSYFLARDHRFREHAIRNMVGSSGRQRVSAADVANYLVNRPDADALAAFGREAEAAFAHMKSLQGENRHLATLRDTLLPQLMSGRLRVKDAEKIVEDHA
ncbi:restriction endonuclease subunit S [Streptomyces albus]|uniref:Restriction endonuclease subunit S n=2 Tax=Streptomyces albus TaxID=1888 RepID=A0A8H1LEL1_9ACTN|nr:restriction endonuclease subunit S [Streptomyces albus]